MSYHREGDKSQWLLRDQVFAIGDLYERVRSWAERTGAAQTTAALPYAESCHSGQYRKGSAHIPYIYHPLMVACHAILLGYEEDDLIAALLLHDVCEDCTDAQGEPILPEALPVGPAAQEAVRRVTKPEDPNRYAGWERDYYHDISLNRLALIIKLLDRCNNISMMATGFKRWKMADYVMETEEYIVPLIADLEASDREIDRRAAFLIRYQLISDLESAKRLLD